MVCAQKLIISVSKICSRPLKPANTAFAVYVCALHLFDIRVLRTHIPHTPLGHSVPFPIFWADLDQSCILFKDKSAFRLVETVALEDLEVPAFQRSIEDDDSDACEEVDDCGEEIEDITVPANRGEKFVRQGSNDKIV